MSSIIYSPSINSPEQLSIAVNSAASGIGSPQFNVISAGGESMIGPSSSYTVITWLSLIEFPQLSVAVHVRVIVYGQPLEVTSTNSAVKLFQQSSFTIMFTGSGTIVQFIVISSGTPTKLGGKISFTVMTCISVIVLLQESVAVHVRVIVYGQPVDIISEKTTATSTVQLSIAVTIAIVGIEVQSTVTSVGTFAKTGAVLSSTVITWVSNIWLLQESVAVHIRVIVYGQPVEIFSVKTTSKLGVQLSLAVTIAAAGIEAQSTVTSFGTFANDGKVLSSTVINWEAIVWFPHESVAVQTLAIKYGQP